MGIEHDLRSLKLHVVPGYRFVEHEFQNLGVVQGKSRFVFCFFCEQFFIESYVDH